MSASNLLLNIILSIREKHPDLVLFLQTNPNAIFNVWLFWMQQVHGKVQDFNSPFRLFGAMKSVQGRTQLDVLMAIVLIAVIHQDFLDDYLRDEVDLECCTRKIPRRFMDMLHELLDVDVISEQLRTGWYSSMLQMVFNLKYPKWVLRTGIWMEHWNIFFGRIDPDGYGVFSIAYVDFRMIEETPEKPHQDRLMIEDLEFFATSFFQNIHYSYDALEAIGNTRWDLRVTQILEKELATLMKKVISQNAFDAGESNNHKWLITEMKSMLSRTVTVEMYMSNFFPIIPIGHETMASIFVYEFWQAHRKPDEIQSYKEYLFWILQQHAGMVSPWALELLSSLGNSEMQLPDIPRQFAHSGDVKILSNCEPRIKDLYIEYGRCFKRLTCK
jgi:hypothetical protein